MENTSDGLSIIFFSFILGIENLAGANKIVAHVLYIIYRNVIYVLGLKL